MSGSGGDSFETDRWQDDQPERDDLLDPEDIDADLVDDDLDEDGLLPDSEELPESQGVDVIDADRFSEDAGARPRLSDEEV